MSDDPRSDIVSDQYARWMYPKPILDLAGWLENNWQWFDPSHSHRMFWPDGAYRPDIDILIAGCGTNQAAIIAYNNPEARVVAIDVSSPSLDHHRYLKNRYALDNLELHLLPIEDVQALGRDFDLIISTGVLHHLASPEKGIQALARCLRQTGVMALMLYARFGRIGVEMLQALFRDLGLSQNDASTLMVRDTLACLPSDHPICAYLSIAPDLQYDAGLVDTFLHGRDRSFSVEDCLELVRVGGLALQDFFLKSAYHPPMASNRAFHAAVASLPREKQWSIMERVNFRNACHFFLACHPERPIQAYQIDFSSPLAPHFVPEFRLRCGVDGDRIVRPNWQKELLPFDAALARQIDGQRSISQIVATVLDDGVLTYAQGINDPHLRAKELIQSLWQTDFIAIGIPAATPSPVVPDKKRTATRKGTN